MMLLMTMTMTPPCPQTHVSYHAIQQLCLACPVIFQSPRRQNVPSFYFCIELFSHLWTATHPGFLSLSAGLFLVLCGFVVIEAFLCLSHLSFLL